MAPLALRVHLNHFNAIIIMRLSNIIFKGFCEEGKELHFLCLTILSRGGEQVNGRGGGDDDEEDPQPPTPTQRPAPPLHPPWSDCTVRTCRPVHSDRGCKRRRVE